MLSIRPATINDAAVLSKMIHELAEFERLAHEASVSEEIIARDGSVSRRPHGALSLASARADR